METEPVLGAGEGWPWPLGSGKQVLACFWVLTPLLFCRLRTSGLRTAGSLKTLTMVSSGTTARTQCYPWECRRQMAGVSWPECTRRRPSTLLSPLLYTWHVINILFHIMKERRWALKDAAIRRKWGKEDVYRGWPVCSFRGTMEH